MTPPAAVLAAPGLEARPEREATGRSLVHLAAFAALAAYGATRWATLLRDPPTGRLLGLAGLSLLLAGCATELRRRGRLITVCASFLTIILALALSGVPLAWLVHLRVSVTASSVGQGLSALPRVLVPYDGVNQWVRLVTVLGAAVLLLDAGFVLAFAPRPPADVHRAGTALPLIALAVVPAALVRPQLPYLQGLFLFALVAMFMWGDRVRHEGLAAALAALAGAGLVAMIVAPRLDEHSPWIDYEALAGSFAPSNPDTFDWEQRYGRITWPRTGRAVLSVRAARPAYWKAEDLDVFDGTGWTQAPNQGTMTTPPPAPSALARFSEQLQVTVGDMTTRNVIAAGTASRPTYVTTPVSPGSSPGTWTASADLGPGDSYDVDVYDPDPAASELEASGSRYPPALAAYRAITLPSQGTTSPATEIVFAPFHARLPIEHAEPSQGNPATSVSASPYAPAYALARRLAGRASTPYAFALRIERYLSGANGFTYSENPPSRRYPLESFLFEDKLGYCQQFAGAMALLLRMGGVPARVADGFTSGQYDGARDRWIVTDLDAHAWVEAWFPGYGWAQFDPTPAAAPALTGSQPGVRGLAGAVGRTLRSRPQGSRAQPFSTSHPGGHSSLPTELGLPLGALVLVLVLALVLRRRSLGPTVDQRLGELERALARSGRAVSGGGVTLAELEHLFRFSPEAAGYIRAIRLQRFREDREQPTARQRRALRAELRRGGRITGRLRALWALPPRWHLSEAGPDRAGEAMAGGRLHSD